jgi:DNA-binding CsgD family transcriptional regulator/tetratricopeptide (TPR) repeat protein
MHPVTSAGLLAGRADELALLDGYLRELARGSGNAVLIEGEPGIGKTTLMRTALASLPSGSCQVFWGAGDELGQELPLSPFLDALGVRRPSANARRTTIAGLLRGEVATDRGADVPAMLAEQLIALTIDETTARPVVLVIDDLQWADPASVKLWGRIARTARQVPLLLVGMTRPAPQRDDLLALRRAVNDEARMQLTALPQSAVAELVKELAGGRPDTGLLRLAAGAAGNPLYLTELFAALTRSGGISITPSGTAQLAADSVPDSLPGAIADRLGFVSATTRQVLRAAALLGVEFALTDLTTVLGRGVADLVPALDEARASGVLIDASGGVGLAFRHPLIREALYAELPSAVRSVWHRDAGHALATAGAAPDRVARQLLRSIGEPGAAGRRSLAVDGIASGSRAGVAPAPANVGAPVSAGGITIDIERPPVGFSTHRSAGSVDEWMLDWLATSADSLVGQAPGVAAELLAQAVAGVPTGSVKHGWLASRLADALYRTGDRMAAEEAAERALVYATDPDLIVDLHWTLTQCRMRSGSAAESFTALEQALNAPGIAAKHRARLFVLAARTYLYLGDAEAAGREANRALTSATEANDTWATGWALHVLAGLATVQGNLADALPLYDRALAVTETDPALYDLGLLLQSNKAATLCNLDRWDEALTTAERARQLADQVGTSVRLAQAHNVLGQALYEMGKWDDALTEISVVPEDLKEPPGACCELSIAAAIGFHRNDPDTARRHLSAAEPHLQRIGHRPIPPFELASSLERELDGALSEALTILTSSFSGTPDDLGEIEDLLADTVRLALRVGDKETAQTVTGHAASLAEGSEIPHRQANALYCRGMVDRDAEVLLAAAQRYADAGRPLPRAKALEAAAECLVQAEERTGARQAFEQAVEIYEFLGAEADLNRVHAEFRAYGIRRGPHSKHRRAVSGWDSLTDTELKVAAFVEEGLSNPEIAARLMLSRRTVATHVSHILKKLNVTTRTDIARESALRAVTAG